MMHCEHCGGLANPGLAHIHGNPCRPLCADCTSEVLKQREAAKPLPAHGKLRFSLVERALSQAA